MNRFKCCYLKNGLLLGTCKHYFCYQNDVDKCTKQMTNDEFQFSYHLLWLNNGWNVRGSVLKHKEFIFNSLFTFYSSMIRAISCYFIMKTKNIVVQFHEMLFFKWSKAVYVKFFENRMSHAINLCTHARIIAPITHKFLTW